MTPINAFALLTDQGHLKGWYANVTEPARLDTVVNPPLLIWHDLFVDLVGLPDNSFVIRDDDELLASGLRQSCPALHERILEARSDLIRKFEAELPPFVASSQLEKILAVWKRHETAL